MTPECAFRMRRGSNGRWEAVGCDGRPSRVNRKAWSVLSSVIRGQVALIRGMKHTKWRTRVGIFDITSARRLQDTFLPSYYRHHPKEHDSTSLEVAGKLAALGIIGKNRSQHTRKRHKPRHSDLADSSNVVHVGSSRSLLVTDYIRL